jgi:hypothetical protein
MEGAAFGVHLVEPRAAGFGDPQAVPEHQQQEMTIAGLIAVRWPFMGFEQAFNLAGGEMLAVVDLRPALPRRRPPVFPVCLSFFGICASSSFCRMLL